MAQGETSAWVVSQPCPCTFAIPRYRPARQVKLIETIQPCFALGEPGIRPYPKFTVRYQGKDAAMAHVLTFMTNPDSWKGWKKSPSQGVVKRDWVPTGRIDFATRFNGNVDDSDQPSEFKLLVEERRIVESITGNENLEIQWRLATLNEAKAVVAQYHKYLSENALIRSVVDETVSLPPPKKMQKIHEGAAA
ncbi:MAG TPA: hypothetical protein VFL49_12755 [Pseudolabrys sp.]|nr:hypothetical protein [Pseudolabrys sp.]